MTEATKAVGSAIQELRHVGPAIEFRGWKFTVGPPFPLNLSPDEPWLQCDWFPRGAGTLVAVANALSPATGDTLQVYFAPQGTLGLEYVDGWQVTVDFAAPLPEVSDTLPIDFDRMLGREERIRFTCDVLRMLGAPNVGETIAADLICTRRHNEWEIPGTALLARTTQWHHGQGMNGVVMVRSIGTVAPAVVLQTFMDKRDDIVSSRVRVEGSEEKVARMSRVIGPSKGSLAFGHSAGARRAWVAVERDGDAGEVAQLWAKASVGLAAVHTLVAAVDAGDIAEGTVRWGFDGPDGYDQIDVAKESRGTVVYAELRGDGPLLRARSRLEAALGGNLRPHRE